MYNMSLVAYDKEADKHAALNAALAELKLHSSKPTAPLTCPAAILKSQEIVAMQTATCDIMGSHHFRRLRLTVPGHFRCCSGCGRQLAAVGRDGRASNDS